jgi:hypothetical protein
VASRDSAMAGEGEGLTGCRLAAPPGYIRKAIGWLPAFKMATILLPRSGVGSSGVLAGACEKQRFDS